MLHESLVKAVKKVGAVVTENRTNDFTAEKDGRFVHWFTQPSYPNKEKQDVTCLHTKSPFTDSMTDCFCDTFFGKIKEAKKYLDTGRAW